MRDETGHIIASRVGYFSIDTNNQGNLPFNFQADVKIHEYENSRQKPTKVDQYDKNNNTNRNVFTDEYEAELKRKERLRLEWQQELQQQTRERELKKGQMMQKKLEEDLKDEERIHRQLREMKDNFQSEHKSKYQPSEPGTPKSAHRKRTVAFNEERSQHHQEGETMSRTRGSVISRNEPPEPYQQEDPH